MKFECTNCGQHLETEEDSAGLSFECPKCGVNTVAPAASGKHSIEPPDAQELTSDQPSVIDHKTDEAGVKPDLDKTTLQNITVESPDPEPPRVSVEPKANTQESAEPVKRSASMKAVLLACWREAFDSGFVPFVVHGVEDACKTMLDFARKPYATLVRFSGAENQEESKSLLAASVSLFVSFYWLVDKIVGSYAEAFEQILDARLDSGSYLHSDKSAEEAFELTQVTKTIIENFSTITEKLEFGVVVLLVGLILTTYYLFRRRSTIDPLFHDEDTTRFIRPTLLFACGYGMILSLVMLISPIFMICAYLGTFGFIMIGAYYLLFIVCGFYMLFGYIKWLSSHFAVSKKRALITYMIVGFVFNITIQIIHFIVVTGPMLIVDKVLG